MSVSQYKIGLRDNTEHRKIPLHTRIESIPFAGEQYEQLVVFEAEDVVETGAGVRISHPDVTYSFTVRDSELFEATTKQNS